MIDYRDMFLSLLLCLSYSYASVQLVQKDGTIVKRPIKKQEYVLEAEGLAPEIEPEVVLRKPKKEQIVQSKSKRKNKSKKSKKIIPEKSEEIDEMEQIYKQEKEFLESKDEWKGPTSRKAASESSKNKVSRKKRASTSVLVEDVQAAVEKQAPLDLLKAVEEKYKTAAFVTIELQKEVTQELLERTKNYKGELSLASQGRLKLEINEPQKSMLLVNAKNVWMVDYPIDDTQNKVQILRSDKPEKLKSQGLIALLIGRKSITDIFEIQDAGDEKGNKDSHELIYKLAPKKNNLDVQTIELHIDSEKQLFTKIIYWDELGNKTSYTFTNHTFSDKSPKGFFEFKKPKNSSITDL